MRHQNPIYLFSALLLTLVLLVSTGPMVHAQKNSAGVKFNLFSVTGLVTGKTIKIDMAYGEEHNVPVQAPFSFLVPDQDGITPLYITATQPNSMLLKVNFATDDRQLVENIQFVVMTLPEGTISERLITLTGLLANRVYHDATKPYPENKYLSTRQIKVGDYDAIEVVGKYIEPNLGLMYLRIVGVLNPNGVDGVFSISNIVASYVDINNFDDLSRTLSGTALRYFKYIEK